MINRYSRPILTSLWSEENKFATWLKVELAACEAQAQLGKIPKAALKAIQSRAGFDLIEIQTIEAETKHDVIAFLTSVAQHVGKESRYIHLGMTSSDVVDTSLSLVMVEVGEILLKDLRDLSGVLLARAKEFKHTEIIGRTHGVHAEPTTFGLKLLGWFTENERNLARMERAVDAVRVGKVSGAVGTFAHIDPRVEEMVCRKLGLIPAHVSTQIIQRDRHAEYLTTLALIASSIEKFATEIRHLQRTEVREAEEAFSEGQKGSSAMPHKRNPITCERLCGLARVVRGNALAGLEDIALWHERDISHSSVERVVLPDSTTLVDYLLVTFRDLLAHLVVYPKRMKQNLEASGVIYSQPLLLALTRKGAAREEAYRWVQRVAMAAWDEGRAFRTLVRQDRDIRKRLSEKEIRACFEARRMLKHVDFIFKRVLNRARDRDYGMRIHGKRI